jgi:hypothetical protein
MSQGHTHKWYFGNAAAVDFQSGFPVSLTNSVMGTGEGSASIADASGNLLFYTNGNTIWGANHVAMPNGTGLFGSSISCQSAVIVPMPSSTTLYYVFTMRNWTDGGNGAHYSIVDMSLNGGLGDVTATKNVILYGNTRESLTAVCHANGTDYWIVIHDMVTNEFHSYLLSASGLTAVPVISTVGSVFTGFNRYGSLKVSPDGNKLAYTLGGSSGVTTELYDFDRATGVITNPLILNNGTFPNAYGVEFSSNSQVLYICEYNGATIQQVDLAAGSPALILASKMVISSGGNVKANLQLAPDNKIYVCLAYQSALAVINNPDVLGLGCGFVNNAVALSGSCGLGLPNFTPCLIPIILPQGWTYFNAKAEGTHVALNWAVDDHASVEGFQVERKGAGSEDFQPVGAFISASAGSATGDFAAKDLNPSLGEYAYRIRAFKQDGSSSLSSVQIIQIALASAKVQVFPNPILDGDVLQISIDHYQGPASISLWDIHMQKVADMEMMVPETGRIALQTKALAKGIYFVTVRLDEEMQVLKVVRE